MSYSYLVLLLVTIVVETGIAILVSPLAPREYRIRFRTDVPLANVFTHPLAFFAIEHGANFWLVEAVVILVELGVYKIVTRMKFGGAAVLSVLLNLVTILIALIAI